ncbi:MAG: tyrosine-type recombinase/integrase [Flavobacteriales bacterium]|jgi:integrase|nr:tyrosine-type recombinase/integrase [Flavobacteriales bacterium]
MFYLLTKKKAKSSISIRKSINKQRFVYSTGISIQVDEWNPESFRPFRQRGRNDLAIISRKLDEMEHAIEDFIYHAEIDKKKITIQDLKSHLDIQFKNKRSKTADLRFYDFVQEFLIDAPKTINPNTKQIYSENLIKKFKQTANRVSEFERDYKRKVLLSDFDMDTYNDLYAYWSQDQEYMYNTIGGFLKICKQLLGIADKHYKYKVHVDYKTKEFTSMEETAEAIVLSEEEIDIVAKLDLSNEPHLMNYQGWLIIGLWTGLRVQDLLTINLSAEDKYIEVSPQKTKHHDISVVIPIHHHIKAYLEEHGMPKVVSSQKFNKYIKQICKIAGFTEEIKGSKKIEVSKGVWRKKKGFYPKYELVTSHTCRRSFATNMYLMNFPTLSIMKITGHTTEKNFLKYIKVTPKEHAEKLMKHWESYYQNKFDDNVENE